MNQREALGKARQALQEHGLPNWTPIIDRRPKVRLGQCRYRQKEIGLTLWHVRNATPVEIMDTILHEVAHALCGPGKGHGGAWKYMARKVGADPTRLGTSHGASPKAKYTAHCSVCDHTYKRHRLTSWMKRDGKTWCSCTRGKAAQTREILEWKQQY